jgi:hypothetical protein
MNKEIKEILENVKKCCDITNKQSFIIYQRQDILKLLDYITNLQEENERLKELYIKTCKHLFNIGNDELARYFQAQINDCDVLETQDFRDEDNE